MSFNKQHTQEKVSRCNYAFDLNKIADFCNYSAKNYVVEREISDGYVDADNGINKVVRELKTPANPQSDAIRLELVRMLMEQVLAYEENKIPYENKLSFNTLKKHEFIKKIDNVQKQQ